MKWVFGVLLVGLGIIGLMFWMGMFEMADPAEQSAALRDQIEPGMGWEKVVAIQPPRKVSEILPESRIGRSHPRDFDETWIQRKSSEDPPGAGFIFEYRFSSAHAVDVYFDGRGQVSAVGKPATMNDLLDGGLLAQ